VYDTCGSAALRPLAPHSSQAPERATETP